MSNPSNDNPLVDIELQHGIARRVVMYFFVMWLVVFSLPTLTRMITEEMPFDLLAAEIMRDFWFPFLISLFILPIVIWDSFRFSNRVAGPIHRVGDAISKVSEDQPVEAVQHRTNDFCGDLVKGVNQLIAKKTTAST